MANHDLTVSLLVGSGIPFSQVPGGVEKSPEKAVLTIAPAYEFQREDDTVGWRVPVPYVTTEAEFTIPGLAELDKSGNKVTWQLRVSFIASRNASAGDTSVLFQIPDGAPTSISYPTGIQIVDVVQPPEYGPTWLEQARLEALASAASSTTSAEQAAIATTKATEVATIASTIATGSPYFMAPILTGGNLNTPRPTLPGGAAWPGPVLWSSQIGRPTNFLIGTDYWQAIAADPLPAVVYLADNFNRADGAPGPSPTGAITPTVTGVGTLSILSNALGWSALASGTDYVTWDTGHADGIYEITVSAIEAAAGIGITFRFASATNHLWMGRVSSTVKNWRFGKRVGSATFVETFGPTTTPTAPVVAMAAGDVVRVTMNGTTITININGTLWFTGTVTDHATNTKHGFSGTNPSVSGASKFDNVSMTALA